MDFKSENLEREAVQTLTLENEKRIITLQKNNTKKGNSGNADEDFELKQRKKLNKNLAKDIDAIQGLKKIIIDYPETYKGFVAARNYFEVAYNTISAECASLGYVCVYGCTLDFGTRIYTIHPNGSKVPVVVTSRCEVYVLPCREEPGKDFVQELSNTWGKIIQVRFGITPEVQLHENLQTRLYREMLQKTNLCKNAEQLLAVLEEVKQVSEQLAHESVIFPEKLDLAEKEFAEVKNLEKAAKIREKQLVSWEKELLEKDKLLLEKETRLNEKEKSLELKEQQLAEIQAEQDRVDDEGFDLVDDD